MNSDDKLLKEYERLQQKQVSDLSRFVVRMMKTLDKRRLKAGIKTKQEWAILSGVSPVMLSHFISGRRNPNNEQVRSLVESIWRARKEKLLGK